MKLSNSSITFKKALPALLLAVAVVMLFLATVVVSLPQTESGAYADANLGWEVFVKYKQGSSYYDFSNSDVYTKSSDGTRAEIYFFVSGYQQNESYEYTVVKGLKQTKAELDACTWTQINPNAGTIYETIGNVTYLRSSHIVETTDGVSKDYYYFRRTYQYVNGSGDTIGEEEYYALTTTSGGFEPIYWYITVNLNNGDENAFRSVTARYYANGATSESAYDGVWTSNPITVTVITEVMENDKKEREKNRLGDEFVPYIYDSSKELLSYSIDFNKYYLDYKDQNNTSGDQLAVEEAARLAAASEAHWQYFTNGTNSISLTQSLDEVTLWFRVTDIAGDYPKFTFYGRGENGLDGVGGIAIPIKLDPETPRFGVSAKTNDTLDNEIDYYSGDWTSTRVTFTLALPQDSKCISGVTFQYSVNGSEFMGLGGSLLEVSETSTIRFRSVSDAGKYYEYPTLFLVNIDVVTPQIRTAGYTIDPDDSTVADTCTKLLKSESMTISSGGDTGSVSIVTAYDPANDKVVVKIYNRDAEGNPIVNISGTRFEYQDVKTQSNWSTMTDVEMSGNERVYRYSLAVGADRSITKRLKFRIVSGAGLSSDEIEVQVTVVNSVFYFDLLEDDYLVAQYNQDGWIADKAIIRAVVSVDNATKPTTGYTFYYWTEELTGKESMETRIKKQAMKAKGEPEQDGYYDTKNGDILWIYRFELEASAESFFNIRAMNDAEKLNNVTRTTPDIIRIDVLEPTYTWDAYIYPSNLDEEEVAESDLKDITKLKELVNQGKLLKIADRDNPDGGWVNGSIYFVLSVEVGVSGINLRNMEFAKNGNSPLYDQSGNLVWQEIPGIVSVDFHEENTTGSGRGKYYYFFNLNNNDATRAIVVEEHRYRIYTGSGISTDVAFTAKFDAVDSIRLAEVRLNSQSSLGDNNYTWMIDTNSGVLSDSSFAVSENFTLSFTSSLDRTGIENHYSLYYYRFGADDMGTLGGSVPTGEELRAFAERVGNEDAIATGEKKYVELTGSAILTEVEEEKQGVFYFAVYLKSKTRNWRNESNFSLYYVICVEYDTLNITIQYRLTDGVNTFANISGEGEEEREEDVAWRTGEIKAYVTLPIDDKGTKVKIGDGYTYYYMLIAFGSRGERPDVESVLSSGVGWVQVRGAYNSDDEFCFDIPFTETAFYGYIGFSVCNKAKYRSIGYSSLKIIRIDNTNPDIISIISGQTEGGLTEERTDTESQKTIISINTRDAVSMNVSAILSDLRHAPIDFYYLMLDGISTAADRYSTGEMTKLESSIDVFTLSPNYSQDKSITVYLLIFAKNSVATSATGFSGSTSWSTGENNTYVVASTIIYEFKYDPSVLTCMELDTTTGSAEVGDSGIKEFLWQEKVGVSTTVKSSERNNIPEYYRFMFSVDDGETWFNYKEMGAVRYYSSDAKIEMTFTAATLASYIDSQGNYPFENGVLKTFRFRAINKAGSYVDCGSVYIAIDETIPEFNILMYDYRGIDYIGGNTLDLNSGDENWTNGPVTISIDITRMPKAGVRVYYYLRYLNSNKSIESPLAAASDGKGKELVSYLNFTTDRLDGFNENRDAIMVVTVVSRAGGAEERLSVSNARISVDQQIPIFTLSGRAFQENSEGASTGIEKIIVSGDWAGKDTNAVSISKERSVANVSPVVYTYTWKDQDMQVPESHTWSETEANITFKPRKASNENDPNDGGLLIGKLVVTATSANGDASKGLSYSVEFDVNIDTTPPTIEFSGGINVIEGSEQYVDLQVVVHGDNLDIVEYITVKEDTRGFTFDPTGYVLATNSVDNSKRHAAGELDPDVYYRGYVRVYVRDKAGHEESFELYVVPFPLTVNTIQLTDDDQQMVANLEYTLSLAVQAGYMEKSRIEYFENLISRLHDRMETLQTEIDGYKDYLAKLATRTSFELRSDYAEMFRYQQTYNNYEVYGQKWIQDAITGTSPYDDYFKNFQNQFDKLFALMEQVEKVQTHVTELPAINMVEAEDYTDILRVYDEYNDLSQDQRSCFVANLYNKLMDLKEACEVLLLSDRETGVVLDGDFAPGATIAVTTYDASTDTYQNAQRLLMNTVDEKSPRAIVSIQRVALTGAYAQTAASDISVSIPIPEEYRSYIEFAVYALGDDGSMRKISGSKIQPDGASVKFSTASLGTYVLCVLADIQGTEADTDSYGSILGIPLTATMIKYILYIGGGLFVVIFLVCLLMGLRQRRFMNSYNRAYRNSIYRRQARGVPKGNKIR